MTTVQKMDVVERMEKQLADLAQKIYDCSAPRFTPMRNWLLIRILPKANKIGLLYTPEKQNKIFYEGIVLETWKPWDEERTKYTRVDGAASVDSVVIHHESQLKCGDRVMFMHFEGQPVPFLDEFHYRMIHETEVHPNGGVWATLHFDEDKGLHERLEALLGDKTCRTISGK